MLGSMAEALGINGTFFIQLVIFLVFYPVLSRLLFKPYFEQEQKRERETAERLKEAEKLKNHTKALEKEYEEKARQLHTEFNQLYHKEMDELKEKFLKQENQKQEEIKHAYAHKQKQLMQDIKQAQQDLKTEVKPLSQTLMESFSHTP